MKEQRRDSLKIASAFVLGAVGTPLIVGSGVENRGVANRRDREDFDPHPRRGSGPLCCAGGTAPGDCVRPFLVVGLLER